MIIGTVIGILICLVAAVPGFMLFTAGHIVLGLLVILSPTITLTVIEVSARIRRRRAAKRLAATLHPAAPTITPAVRAELDQTHEWWDRQYRELERRHISRAVADHDGHAILEHRTYASTTIHRTCTTCSIELDPHQEQHS